MSHWKSLAFATAVLALLLAACAPAAPAPAQPTTAPAPKAAAPMENVNFRISWKANGGYSQIWLAREKGFFAAEGLNVEINEGTGSIPVVQTVAGGQDFMSMPSLDALILARAKGAPARAVAVFEPEMPAGLAVLAKSGIKKPQDLVGKTISSTPGGTSYTLLAPYLKANGISPDSVKVAAVDGAAKVPALLEGRVDAATVFLTNDWVDVRAKHPDALYFSYGDVLPMYGLGLAVSEDTLKNRPGTVGKAVRAVIKAYRYAIEHPDESIDALLKHLPAADSKVLGRQRLDEHLRLFKKTEAAAGCLGCMSDKAFSGMEELLTQYMGLDKKAGKMADYYTNEFVK